MSVSVIVMGANGRMGRTICSLVRDNPDYSLAGAVDRQDELGALAVYGCPVAADLAGLLGGRHDQAIRDTVIIDFSTPAATIAALAAAARYSLPCVIGTTGFNQSQKDVIAGFAREIPVLCSANMSIGVNVLMAFLPELAKALGPAYDIELTEIHHRKKKDAPSGTALMLANGLAAARGWKLGEVRCSCRDGMPGERPDSEIGVLAVRGGDVVGIHTTYFLGPGETIEIRHQAESRENFAQGALRAAAWLVSRPAGSVYTMQDVIREKL